MFRVLSGVFLALSELDISASTAKHKIIVGTFNNTEFLYTVEYDAKGSLALVSWSAVSAAGSWITLNSTTRISYTALAGTPRCDLDQLRHSRSAQYQRRGEDCGRQYVFGLKKHIRKRAPKKPYSVHGNYYYGDARCGTVLSVHENGTSKEVIRKYVHLPGPAVHGTATTPSRVFLLSADTKGNLIWTHKIDEATGILQYMYSWLGLETLRNIPNPAVPFPTPL